MTLLGPLAPATDPRTVVPGRRSSTSRATPPATRTETTTEPTTTRADPIPPPAPTPTPTPMPMPTPTLTSASTGGSGRRGCEVVSEHRKSTPLPPTRWNGSPAATSLPSPPTRATRTKARAAIEQLARQIDRDRRPGEAAKLEEIASLLGAVDILYLPIVGHGYTQWKRGGPVIHLSLSRNDGRRRFLLAHECGHLIFDRMINEDPDRAWSEFGLDEDDPDSLEVACNEFANEVLVPAEQLRTAKHSLVDLDSLRQAAADFRVSLTALVYRLNRLREPRTLLHLRYSCQGEWVITDRIGAPKLWRGSVDLGQNTQDALSVHLPVAQCTSLPLELVAWKLSTLVQAQVRVSPSRQHALALFDSAQLPTS